NASPGAAMGTVVVDPDEAEKLGRDERKPLILVRVETSPDDVHGVLHSKGVLTARGGATSHAAVVTRGLGIPCVAGCEDIQVDYDAAEFRVGDKVVRRGDGLSIDGGTGEVFAGSIRTIEPDFDREVDLQNLLAGRTRCGASRCGPTPTTRGMPCALASLALRGLGSTGRNTCSWKPIGSRSSMR